MQDINSPISLLTMEISHLCDTWPLKKLQSSSKYDGRRETRLRDLIGPELCSCRGHAIYVYLQGAREARCAQAGLPYHAHLDGALQVNDS